jgi:hypothetical protein
MFRYGHVITTSIANEAERAYFEGAFAMLKAVNDQTPLGTSKYRQLRSQASRQAAEYGDSVHDSLATPRQGSAG